MPRNPTADRASLAGCLTIALALCAGAPGAAGETAPVTRPRLLVVEYGSGQNRILEIAPDGRITWEHKPVSQTVMAAPVNGDHVLYGFGGRPAPGAREIARDGAEVWRFTSSCTQLFCCRRLDNGNTLVAEQGPCQAVEVDAKGKVVRTTPLTTSCTNAHRQVRNLHLLPNGNILAGFEGEGAVREVDPQGTVVWEMTGIPNANDAQRLENGNTLISGGTSRRVIEVTPDKKVVWEFGAADAPELNIIWVGSVQRRANGNLVICNFIRGQLGKGAHAFEVTREKKVVWAWMAADAPVKSITTAVALDD